MMLMKISPNQKGIFLYLVILFVINLLQSIYMELSFDEAYYWVYAQNSSWGYYDHPPMVAWMINIGNALFSGELGVRIIFNLFTISGLYLLWHVSDFKRTSHFIMITMSMPLLQASGFLALPDTGLFFFTALFLFYVKKYLSEDKLRYIFIIATIIALLFYSKYHGLAVVLLTTFAMPSFLKRKSFWYIVCLSIILYLPHLHWQYLNDFITFKFHLFKRTQKVFEWQNIFHSIFSQVFVFGIATFYILLSIIKKIKNLSDWYRILYFNTIGLLILLFIASLRNSIEANWSITACAAAVPLLMLMMKEKKFHKAILALNGFSIVILLIFRGILILPPEKLNLTKLDRLNEVKGWNERVEEILKYAGEGDIIADSYQVAAKLSFHLKRHIHAIHINSRESQYSLLKNRLLNIKPEQEITYITNQKFENALKIETGYKDPIYLIKTSLGQIAKDNGLTYEEIIRN
jgi:hypothetical protein